MPPTSSASSVSAWLVDDHCSFAIEPSGPGMPTFIVAVSARIAPSRRPSIPIFSRATLSRTIGSSAAAALLGQLDQLVERVREPERRGGAEAGALVHQRRDRDHPAVALAADDVLVGDVGVLDEELVELGLAGDLAQRPHLDLVLLHVHEEVGEPLVLGGVGVGAGDEHAPLRLVGERRPDLLAGDPPAAVLLHRLRLQRGEVRARLRLGEALAPDLLGREDRLEEALLLLLGAVGDHDRARPSPGRARWPGAGPWRAPAPRRRSTARSASRRGRRTPSATRSRPSRPRAACAATRARTRTGPGRRPAARDRDGSPRARREPRRGRPAPRG